MQTEAGVTDPRIDQLRLETAKVQFQIIEGSLSTMFVLGGVVGWFAHYISSEPWVALAGGGTALFFSGWLAWIIRKRRSVLTGPPV